jgi:hypothetical protein
MITEEQRKKMLHTIAMGTIDPANMQRVVAKLKSDHNIDATPEMITKATDWLKKQKGVG